MLFAKNKILRVGKFPNKLTSQQSLVYMKDKKENLMHMPIDFRIRGGKYYVVSAILPRQNLNEPFFLDSLSYRFAIAEVNKNKPEEQNALVRPLHYDKNDSRLEYIPIEDFINTFSKETIAEDKLKFIFHMSRCGSTLATQMLATSERFFVVSEPPIILALLGPSLILTGIYSKANLDIDKVGREEIIRQIYLTELNSAKSSLMIVSWTELGRLLITN